MELLISLILKTALNDFEIVQNENFEVEDFIAHL